LGISSETNVSNFFTSKVSFLWNGTKTESVNFEDLIEQWNFAITEKGCHYDYRYSALEISNFRLVLVLSFVAIALF
jgi:hypothetical protein